MSTDPKCRTSKCRSFEVSKCIWVGVNDEYIYTVWQSLGWPSLIGCLRQEINFVLRQRTFPEISASAPNYENKEQRSCGKSAGPNDFSIVEVDNEGIPHGG